MTTEQKSPQQCIFDEVFKVSVSIGYRTFDYIPSSKAKYPFVVIGEQFDSDLINKTNVQGLVTQTIHVYHTHKKRRELTGMVNSIKEQCRKIKRAGPYSVTVRGVDGQTIIDNSTSETLLHGIIEIQFRFN